MPEAIPVVMVVRNGLPMTKRALASIMAQDVPVDVLVINNQSTDGSAPWLQSKPISVIHTDEQWSLSKCWNVALRWFWGRGYDRALVVNSDVELLISTARLLSAHGGPFVTCVSVNTPEQLTNPILDIDELRKTERNHPDFSAYFIRKSVTDRNLWFDEEYFPAYVEDASMHVRLHRAGIPAVCISLPFLHHGASTLKTASAHDQRIIREGADRNRERFRAKYGCVPGTPAYEALFT